MEHLGPPRLSPSSWVDLCLETGPKGQGRHVGTAAVQHPVDGSGLWEGWFPGATWIQVGVGWVTEQLWLQRVQVLCGLGVPGLLGDGSAPQGGVTGVGGSFLVALRTPSQGLGGTVNSDFMKAVT